MTVVAIRELESHKLPHDQLVTLIDRLSSVI